MQYKFLMAELFSKDICRQNPNHLFVFGDNTQKVGMGGQAFIREEPNAVGISTKFSPGAYFSDEQFEANKELIEKDIAEVNELMESGRFTTLVFPTAGLGWGRANIQQECPKTALYLCQRLLEEYNFNNLADLINTRQF